MKKRLYPLILTAFCACAHGCASKDVAATDPLPTVPDSAKIDLLNYVNLPPQQLDGLMRVNTIVSLFHQAGAAASHGECNDAKDLIRAATSTPLRIDIKDLTLANKILKKLLIAQMVGKNAQRACSKRPDKEEQGHRWFYPTIDSP